MDLLEGSIMPHKQEAIQTKRGFTWPRVEIVPSQGCKEGKVVYYTCSFVSICLKDSIVSPQPEFAD